MKSNYKKLAPYIRLVDIRNTSDERCDLLGVSVDKHFIKSIANTIGTDWRTYKVIQKGQFCYIPDTSRRGDKMGIALLTDYDIALVSQAYTVFEIINQEQLLPEYLNLWFKRPEFDRYARFHSHGSVREIFDWEEMCNVELPIPEIEEQRKIVEAYKTIEKRIALKRKINDNLADQLATLLAKLFYDNNVSFDNLPNNWTVSTLGTYCDVKSGYAFKSDWWQDGGVKIIKIANIKDFTIDFNDCSYVSAENAQKATQFSVVPGDILIAMTGATTGKFGIVPFIDFVPRVNQRVGKFFLGSEPLKKAPFLFATLLQKDVIKKLQPDGETGSAQDNLSPDDIKNIPIIYPSVEIIDAFNDHNKAILKQMMVNFAEINSLNDTLTVFLQTLSSF